MANRKIVLVGSGNIGGTLAHLIALKNLADVALLDVVDGIPQGKALDLNQGMALEHSSAKLSGGTDYTLLANADVVIITAGITRKPGMSRDDLLSTNARIIQDIAYHSRIHCPHAFVIVVTNPLDVMVGLFQQESGLPHQRVVGMAGVLDSARFRHFLAQALDVHVGDIHTFVLGGHGDMMVPLIRYTSVAGIPLPTLIKQGLISQQVVEAIIQRTRQGGAEIVNFLKTGSAFYAPATAAIAMAEAYLKDQKRILPCAVWLTGEYGVKDFYVGVPVVIGAKGVERILELELTPEEKAAFKSSVQAVRTLRAEVQKLQLPLSKTQAIP